MQTHCKPLTGLHKNNAHIFNFLNFVLEPECSYGEKHLFPYTDCECASEKSCFLITNICELPADDTVCDRQEQSSNGEVMNFISLRVK